MPAHKHVCRHVCGHVPAACQEVCHGLVAWSVLISPSFTRLRSIGSFRVFDATCQILKLSKAVNALKVAKTVEVARAVEVSITIKHVCVEIRMATCRSCRGSHGSSKLFGRTLFFALASASSVLCGALLSGLDCTHRSCHKLSQAVTSCHKLSQVVKTCDAVSPAMTAAATERNDDDDPAATPGAFWMAAATCG